MCSTGVDEEEEDALFMSGDSLQLAYEADPGRGIWRRSFRSVAEADALAVAASWSGPRDRGEARGMPADRGRSVGGLPNCW